MTRCQFSFENILCCFRKLVSCSGCMQECFVFHVAVIGNKFLFACLHAAY